MPDDANSQNRDFQSHGSCQELTRIAFHHISKNPAVGHSRRYHVGGYVWRHGDRADHIYILVEGEVRILITNPAGVERLVRDIGVGEPFGEFCFCAELDGSREDSARVAKESRVIALNFAGFVSQIKEEKGALTELIATMCARISKADRLIEALSYRAAELRLGHLLFLLAGTKGISAAAGRIEAELSQSHEELALMAAMSRSHVSVTMGKLRKRGLLDYGRGRPLRVRVDAMRNFLRKSSESSKN